MSNNINTIKSNGAIIAKVAAGMLVDNLQFAKTISQADPLDYNGKNGYSAGDTIYVSKPARFIPTGSFDITSSIQDVVEEKVPLTLDILSTVPVSLDSQELASTINIKSIAERIIKPAVAAIAQDVEKTMLNRAALATYNYVGTAGSTVFDTDMMLSASAKMQEYLCPQDDEQYALLNPQARRSAVNARKGLFQSSSEIASQYKSGYMGDADGFHYMSNNLLPRLTTGTQTNSAFTLTTTSVNGATTVALTGLSGGTLKAGQVFTIASVNAVHPQTKADLGYLQEFVVTANNTAVSTAYTGVAISPTIYDAATGLSLQNVSALPTSGAVITLVGSTVASTTYGQNLTYHKNAFRMVSVPLVMPDAVELAVQETYKGVTVAVVRAFDVLKRRMITRIDFLGGFCATRPEWACRITSQFNGGA